MPSALRTIKSTPSSVPYSVWMPFPKPTRVVKPTCVGFPVRPKYPTRRLVRSSFSLAPASSIDPKINNTPCLSWPQLLVAPHLRWNYRLFVADDSFVVDAVCSLVAVSSYLVLSHDCTLLSLLTYQFLFTPIASMTRNRVRPRRGFCHCLILFDGHLDVCLHQGRCRQLLYGRQVPTLVGCRHDARSPSGRFQLGAFLLENSIRLFIIIYARAR
jgi:hypothetical protein